MPAFEAPDAGCSELDIGRLTGGGAAPEAVVEVPAQRAIAVPVAGLACVAPGDAHDEVRTRRRSEVISRDDGLPMRRQRAHPAFLFLRCPTLLWRPMRRLLLPLRCRLCKRAEEGVDEVGEVSSERRVGAGLVLSARREVVAPVLVVDGVAAEGQGVRAGEQVRGRGGGKGERGERANQHAQC